MLIAFLMTSSDILIFETAALNYYVTPNKTLNCSDDHSTCLTIQEYANQADIYFTSNTIFYFEPGRHMLNSSLHFVNIHYFTFQGLPDSEMVNVLFGSLVSITWNECSSIEVSSIVFTLLGNFTFSIVFTKTHSVGPVV